MNPWELRIGEPFDAGAGGRRLLDAALDALTVLPRTQGEPVLVNQDLHGDNVLAAQREPWLLIDPKPLVAEREFAPRRSSVRQNSATPARPSSTGRIG